MNPLGCRVEVPMSSLSFLTTILEREINERRAIPIDRVTTEPERIVPIWNGMTPLLALGAPGRNSSFHQGILRVLSSFRLHLHRGPLAVVYVYSSMPRSPSSIFRVIITWPAAAAAASVSLRDGEKHPYQL